MDGMVGSRSSSSGGRNILEIQVLYHPPMKEVKAHKGHHRHNTGWMDQIQRKRAET